MTLWSRGRNFGAKRQEEETLRSGGDLLKAIRDFYSSSSDDLHNRSPLLEAHEWRVVVHGSAIMAGQWSGGPLRHVPQSSTATASSRLPLGPVMIPTRWMDGSSDRTTTTMAQYKSEWRAFVVMSKRECRVQIIGQVPHTVHLLFLMFLFFSCNWISMQ